MVFLSCNFHTNFTLCTKDWLNLHVLVQKRVVDRLSACQRHAALIVSARIWVRQLKPGWGNGVLFWKKAFNSLRVSLFQEYEEAEGRGGLGLPVIPSRHTL